MATIQTLLCTAYKQCCCIRETYCLQSMLPIQSSKTKHMRCFEGNRHFDGAAKLCCLLCEWASCVNSLHYSKNWPLHTSHTPGTKNIALQHIVDNCKVLLPPLHIKLGLGKNFEQTLDQNGPAMYFLWEKFPELSMEKIKADAFIGLKIRQLFTDTQYDLAVSDVEKAACNAFWQDGTGFFF